MAVLLEKQGSRSYRVPRPAGVLYRGGVLEGRSASLLFFSIVGFTYTVGVLIFCLVLLALGLYHLIHLSLCLGLFDRKKGR